ncbi:TPA: hypothetical protein SL179_002155 [Pseudomonas aeruginosa]|nr:hypothetical protein [Pseudomonas aeruginosa]HEJ4779466.1 hypothetical protein [Pseudomonas aeruginosa]
MPDRSHARSLAGGVLRMRQKPGIALPRWLLRTTTMQMHSVDVVLVMALVLQHHGTADAVRRAAGQLRDRVCAEHRPKMTALMRMQDDVAALQVALNIVQRATDALGILPETAFPAGPVLTNRYLETQLSPGPYQWTREVSLCATPSSTKTSPASST